MPSSTFQNELEKNDNLALWILLDHARNALARSRELELAQFNLTPEQQIVLYTLWSCGGSATNAEIAERTIRQYNSVTTLVNRMETAGLVTKEKAPHDKRYIVTMTEKGRKIYGMITTKCIDMAFAELSAEDKARLSSYLVHIEERGRKMLGMDIKLPFLI